MNSVTANTEFEKSLNEAGPLVEVKNETGKIIGYFAPLSTDRAASYAAAAAAARLYGKYSGPTPERTYTTAEVMAHLKSLEATQCASQ